MLDNDIVRVDGLAMDRSRFHLTESLVAFLFLSAYVVRFSDAQVFVVTPTNPIQAQYGTNVTLHWNYISIKPVTLVLWGILDEENKFQSVIAQKNGSNEVQYLASYRERARIQAQATLVLIDVKVNDSGRYGCQLTFAGESSPLFNSTRLIVSEPLATTVAPTARESSDEEDRKIHPIYLALAVVILILILLVFAYFFMTRTRRAVVIDKRNSQAFGPDLKEVQVEMDQFSSNETDADKNIRQGESPDLARQDYCVIPPLLPNSDEKDWEIPRDSLVFVKVIGKGAFGQVAKGMAVGLANRKENQLVAIKMLRKNATDENRQDLLAELNTMKKLEPHPNVIQLLGCVTKSDPIMGITEYVPYGDLLGYLRRSRGLQDTYYNDAEIKPQSSLSSKRLFGFAWDIANGMDFLSSKKIVHRDLAARNVLVGDGEVCKITDFGLAREVFKDDLYRRNATGRVPVKWTAFESLLYGNCTTMGDVWSYGIVMYEIFTIGGTPYPKVDSKDIASLLQEGYRMPKPTHLDTRLYDAMKACWNEKPEERPSFADLREMMKEMGEEEKIYINLEDYDTKLYQNVDDLDA